MPLHGVGGCFLRLRLNTQTLVDPLTVYSVMVAVLISVSRVLSRQWSKLHLPSAVDHTSPTACRNLPSPSWYSFTDPRRDDRLSRPRERCGRKLSYVETVRPGRELNPDLSRRRRVS